MPTARTLALASLTALALAACSGPRDFVECVDQTSCGLAVGGQCLENPATGHQFCAYPDQGCMGGLRWSDYDVEEPISGQCVEVPDGGTDGVVDTTAPTIVTRSPDANATAVTRTAAISVMFSEDIAPASVDATSFRVTGPGGTAVAGALSVLGSSATFAPAVPWTPQTEYTVAIGTQVTDLAANHLATSSTWSFTTGSANWSAPVLLETEMTLQASDPVAGSGGGTVMAVWLMSSCNGICQLPSQIWYAVRTGGAWSPAAAISGVVGAVGAPALAVDASGRATLVFPATVGVRTSMYAARYDAGAWSVSALIETDDSGNATTPAVAADAGGNAYAVWQQHDGTRTNIMANRYVVGSGWGSAAPLELATGAAEFPHVAAGADGSAFAVWTQATMMYGARFSGGAWGQPALAGAGTGRVRVAMHTDGSAIAVWANGNDILANRNTGAWGTAAPIDSLTAPSLQAFTLAMPDGSAMAVWSQLGDLWQARYTAASGWSPALRLENAGGSAQDPSLAFAPDGSGICVWEQPSPAAMYSPWANLFLPTTGWGAAQLAKPDDGVAIDSPVAYFDSGDNSFGIVWLAAPSGLRSVYAAALR